jgi:hypothetical protein
VAVVTLVAIGAPARAVVISVDLGGGPELWNVSPNQVVAGTDPQQFIPTYITSQRWSGNQAIAGKFAEALAGKLGYPNDGQYSPFFAYEALTDPQTPGVAYYLAAGTLTNGVTYELFQPPSTDPTNIPPPNNFYTYATANRVTTGVPGPLPVLGGLAAFGWSRRLRRRVALPSRP